LTPMGIPRTFKSVNVDSTPLLLCAGRPRLLSWPIYPEAVASSARTANLPVS
jgi:hypothetical protein